LIHRLENHANSLNDSDAEWWPFLCLRVRPNERITVLRTLLLAIAYAAPAALLALVLGAILGDPVEPSELLVFLPVTVLGVFLLLQVSVAYSWNRRAVRIRARPPRR
jgi:hypothetical protein